MQFAKHAFFFLYGVRFGFVAVSEKRRAFALPFYAVWPIIIPRATRAINCLILFQPLPVMVSRIFSL